MKPSPIIVLFGDPPPMRSGPSGFLVSLLVHLCASVLLYLGLHQARTVDSRPLSPRYTVRVMELRKQELKLHPPLKTDIEKDTEEALVDPGQQADRRAYRARRGSRSSSRASYPKQPYRAETGAPDPHPAGCAPRCHHRPDHASPGLCLERAAAGSQEDRSARAGTRPPGRRETLPHPAQPGSSRLRPQTLLHRVRYQGSAPEPEQDLAGRRPEPSEGPADSADCVEGHRPPDAGKRNLPVECSVAGGHGYAAHG